ncbi:GNAT family N-acetyltransferase [Pseudalkalibacillus berkeleyi]|uniref:GNAT family N-acetyltransferase n=1 Tax=Pseudalkalibacillus berkeleyi TaxID=1069813 RepID=A0ABS9H398_9BACL|nr:GNAT family N-acetyltransferase [Pseudalkalibacillus berkeleyi]MCF6138435.1 GNAT family N-acetyltransferase [Pseudalkalibacillus berkeleyi]
MIFEKNEINKWKIELEIMNSNSSYNLLSKNKRTISFEDIKSEFEESKKLNTTRTLIKKSGKYIGLVDYCIENPSDHTPWISLFVIHKQYQGSRNSLEAFRYLEDLIRQEDKKKLRLAVHKENENGLLFWTKLGFNKFKEVVFDGKPHYCLEKDI